MSWNLRSDTPIYSQIIDEIKSRIISGEYTLGSKLPSVRELATEAGVNPNTMQKAMSELEREGLLCTMRTSGRIITEDENAVFSLKEQTATMYINEFLTKLKQLGFTQVEILELIKKNL